MLFFPTQIGYEEQICIVCSSLTAISKSPALPQKKEIFVENQLADQQQPWQTKQNSIDISNNQNTVTKSERTFQPIATARLYFLNQYFASKALLKPSLNDTDSTSTRKPTSIIEGDDDEEQEDAEDKPSFKKALSVTEIDSIDAALNDSTTRLQQFKYRRVDVPYLTPIEKKTYALFLPKTAIERKVVLDSTMERIKISETIAGYEVRPSLDLSFDYYKQLRLKATIRDNFRQIIGQQTVGTSRDALADVFSKITRISVYVPGGESAIFATLFGPPTVSVQVAGNIDIKASYQAEESEDPIRKASGTASTAVPNFDQQVQMNLTGTIGDKLTITADWNTERPFQYENQLAIRYKGYEDDLVQSIEAGNVSLALPTTLIGSNQALFGIKAQFQIAGLNLTAIASQQRGRTESFSVQSGSSFTEQTIQAWDYDEYRHFFVSNFFVTNWEKAFGTQTPQLFTTPPMQGRQINRLEVWRQPGNGNIIGGGANTPNNQQVTRQAVALLNLGDKPYSLQDLQSEDGFPFPNNTYNDLTDPSETPAFLENLRTSPTLPSLPAGRFQEGNFILMSEGQDYIFNPILGYITFIAPLDRSDIIAVSYDFTQPGGLPPIKVGDFSTDSLKARAVFKLVKPAQFTPSDSASWILMLKNIYALGGRDIQPEAFNAQVFYQNPGDNPPENEVLPLPGFTNTLNNLLGFDRFDPNGVAGSDRTFDFIPGYNIDPQRGLLIFPFQRPFEKPIRDEIQRITGAPITEETSRFVYNEIYDRIQFDAQNTNTKNFYVLKAKYKSSVQNPISIGFNVAQGSVRVTSRGVPLTEGIDFNVDYQLGQVTILKNDALQQGSNLKIDFEKNDLFLLASRSIVGLRADYTFSDDFKLGATFLQYSERPLTDKVRVGDEPIVNRILGFDMQYATRLRWLTKAIDALPLISTKEISKFTFNAEYAQILPSIPDELRTQLDPEGVSYIDDFEGSKQIISFGLNGNNWSLGSSPHQELENPTILEDSIRASYRAQLGWYRLPIGDPRNVATREIFPNRVAAREDFQVRPLYLSYNPTRRGPYNFNTNFVVQGGVPDSAFGAITQILPSFANNLTQSNIQFIEFWFKYQPLLDSLIAPTDSGKLHIDIGIISEDIIPNRRLNTEDGMPINPEDFLPDQIAFGTDGYGRYNTRVAKLDRQLLTGSIGTEDVGLDGINDELERTTHAEYLDRLRTLLGENNPEYLRILNDPAGDNFSLDVTNVSGTEGNANQAQAGAFVNIFPDTEDLDGSTTVQTQNRFFRYTIPVNPQELNQALPTGKFVVGGGTSNAGWVQFRVPLEEFTKKFGAIDFTTIQFARVWVEEFRQPAQLGFATFDFVGSQWQQVNRDTLISIASVNIEENGSFYTLPPGIQRARDRQRVDQNIQANEQSLLIVARDLGPDSSRAIFRNFAIGNTGGFNLNPYKRLKAFVHAGAGTRYNDLNPQDPTNTKVFLRFGATESNNYYEIRFPVKPSPTVIVPQSTDSPEYRQAQELLWPIENNIDLDLDEIASFKLQRASDTETVFQQLPDGRELIIRGQPSLGNVRVFSFGVLNPSNEVLPSVELWLNELRVSGYKQDGGWAVRANSSLQLADIATISANYQRQTPDFHGLNVRQNQIAAQNNTESWTLSTTLNADKLLPAEEGWSIPVTIERSESRSEPKYVPGRDDIQLEAAIARTIEQAKKNGANETEAQQIGERFRDQQITLTTSERFAIPNIRKAKPSDFWLARFTIDRLTVGYNYSLAKARSPALVSSEDWQWSANASYGLQLPVEAQLFIEPFKLFKSIPILNAFSDDKFYYIPQSYGADFLISRERRASQNRGNNQPLVINSNNFSTTRGMTMQYKVSETFDMAYNARLTSSLNLSLFKPFSLNDSVAIERKGSEVLDAILSDLAKFDLGIDQNYAQAVTSTWRPKMIPALDWLNASFTYSSQYNWSNPFVNNPAQFIGNSVQNNSSLQVQSDLKIKELFSKIRALIPFGKGPESPSPKTPTKPARFFSLIDSTNVLNGDEEGGNLSKLVGDVGSVLKVFTNFDQFRITYSITTGVQSSGIAGGAGWFNFYPFNTFGDPNRPVPPSLSYQLGFSDNPGARYLVDGGATQIPRFNDNFNQTQNVGIGTTWAITDNIRVDLNWRTDWSFRKGSVIDGASGDILASDRSGTITRTYISIFPSIDDFREAVFSVDDTASSNTNLEFGRFKGLFERTFEPTGIGRFTAGIFGQSSNLDYIPLPNWRISLTGLEKLDLLSGFATAASIEHAYTGTYSTSFTQPQNSAEVIGNQIINESFAPLFGLTMQWKFGMNTSVSVGKTRSLTLAVQNYQITQANSMQLALSLGYTKSGLKIPLNFWPFNGTTLENTIDFSFNFSFADNETQTIIIAGSNAATNPPIGTTQLTFQPRLTYALSQRVNASAFWQYTQTQPKASGGSTVFASTRQEIGFNFRVSIGN